MLRLAPSNRTLQLGVHDVDEASYSAKAISDTNLLVVGPVKRNGRSHQGYVR